MFALFCPSPAGGGWGTVRLERGRGEGDEAEEGERGEGGGDVVR